MAAGASLTGPLIKVCLKGVGLLYWQEGFGFQPSYKRSPQDGGVGELLGLGAGAPSSWRRLRWSHR